MNRYTIQKKVTDRWQGIDDCSDVAYALECARTMCDWNTIDVRWRWLAQDLQKLWDESAGEAMACYNFLNGWMAGYAFKSSATPFNSSLATMLKPF